MLYLKKVNSKDALKEYEAIKKILPDENGFTNVYYASTRDDFIHKIIPSLIGYSKGIDLKEGYVPYTEFFLWNDDKIVGLFRIRHYLNDSLKEGAGHIGYTILKEYRGRGYAKEGLKLAIQKCKKIIKEDEIYLRVKKNNIASLKVQLKCGAHIVKEDEEHIFTRIKLIK